VAIDPSKGNHESFLFEKDWWKRGEHKLQIPADWWRLGENDVTLVYSTQTEKADPPLSVTWVDLLLDYSR